MYRVLMLALLVVSQAALAVDEPAFYVVTWSPGAKWDHTRAFDSQPGMTAHLQYLAKWQSDDSLLLAGPLTGETSMAVVRGASLEQVSKIAAKDPAVIGKLLTVKVRVWKVEFSSLPKYQRVVPAVQSPGQPFTIQRTNPDAPIRLKSRQPK